jgi:epoxyqueuosine reductase
MEIIKRELDRQFPLWAILVDPPDVPEGAFFSQWLAGKHHAGMAYLERSADRRLSLQAGYPGYRSLVIALLPYESFAFRGKGEAGRAEIARYAVGEDYHRRFDKAYQSVLSAIRELLPSDDRPLVKPDHGALLEKSFAQMAGLGVMGKNTLLINPLLGSWFTMGCLLLKTPLVTVKRSYSGLNPCGSCTRCLSECPTDAFVAPYHLNAGRCLSYLTIERPDDPLSALRKESDSRWLFGCDRCQEVCPHNGAPLRQDRGSVPGETGGEEGGRFMELDGLSEDRVLRFRKENSALERVSVRQMMERLSEIRERDRKKTVPDPDRKSPGRKNRESAGNSL